VSLKPNSLLLLLPDPVACFKDASYNQVQHFTMHKSSSLALLDWVTSGRRVQDEDWSFARYYSANTVLVDDTTIARDVMRLEKSEGDSKVFRTLAEKLAPYGCYATLLLRGPLLQAVINDLTVRYKAISVFKKRAPDPLIWSLSPIASGAIVVRIAGLEVEGVKSWLQSALEGIKEHVGEDAFRRAFV
jgi:urease accessory protein